MMLIWCVDDNDAIREIEVYTLTSTGFEARGFCDGASMVKALQQQVPDLILLDIMLPGEDGVTILKRIRSNPKTKEVPVIMATAKGTEMDKIHSLDLGADDYLVKPFGMMEMVSRIKAVLRRAAPPKDEVLQAGEITLRVQEHLVTVRGRPITLTRREFELLRLLMGHPGVVFSRERLLSELWGTDYLGETRTVDVHIGTLRQKLGEAGKSIETVIGVGYRLGGVT